MDPSRFRVGDIVEVALSIACFEIKDKKYIMIPILRAITLFDQEIRNVSFSQHSAVVLEIINIYRLPRFCVCVKDIMFNHRYSSKGRALKYMMIHQRLQRCSRE